MRVVSKMKNYKNYTHNDHLAEILKFLYYVEKRIETSLLAYLWKLKIVGHYNI